METIDVLRLQLEAQTSLTKNWDSYDADPPNSLAIANMRTVLESMATQQLDASRVVPSAEGGLGVVWMSEFGLSRLAYIECCNDGSAGAVTSDNAGAVQVWYIGDIHRGDVDSVVLTLEETLERIRHFIWANHDC
jgi:hypothetical protein